ncbi:hypothetical protein A9Q81_22715 [Gammaproteobacteria bacterium 42_54_T18]|nr:hypothetical protein A9Q81_22715 [Gammaproteobacteria bacterium 42_54_T18]
MLNTSFLLPSSLSSLLHSRKHVAILLVTLFIGTSIGCGNGSSSGDSTNRATETADENNNNDNSNNEDNDTNNNDNIQAVVIKQGQLTSPFTSQFPNIPEECHNVQFLHYTPTLDTNNQPYQRETKDADTIFFFMPGLLAGAGAFNYLAEQLVLEAFEQQHQIAEVIVLDRRDQCLRDLAGLEEAEQQKDISFAVDYYYNQSSINDKKFEGIKSSSDLPWLSDMGLALVQEDLMAVLSHLVPDPIQRQEKVFIGGHSLGGLLTHSFAGWDFDGDLNTSDDAGYNQAAGFIRLDIDVTPKDETLDRHLDYGQDGFMVDANDKANQRYQQDIEKLVQGKSSRIMEMPGLDTETFFLLEMLAMVADWSPDEEATLVRDLPIGSTTNLMLKLIHARSIGDFLNSNTGIRDFRYTNQALLGAVFDDDFMPVGILQASVGFLQGGNITQKSFPLNPTLSAILNFIAPDLANLLSDETLYIPTDSMKDSDNVETPPTAPLYSWVNFDDIQNDVHLNTTEEEEVTDIVLFAKSIYQGPGTFAEWYMSARVGLELDAISQPSPIAGLNFWHAKAARNKPLLEIAGERGLAKVDDNTDPLGTLIVAKGYDHVDLLSASNHHKARRENAVITPILEFAQQHKGSL